MLIANPPLKSPFTGLGEKIANRWFFFSARSCLIMSKIAFVRPRARTKGSVSQQLPLCLPLDDDVLPHVGERGSLGSLCWGSRVEGLACRTFWQTMTWVPRLLPACLAFPTPAAGAKGSLVRRGQAVLLRCLLVASAAAGEASRLTPGLGLWLRREPGLRQWGPIPGCLRCVRHVGRTEGRHMTWKG